MANSTAGVRLLCGWASRFVLLRCWTKGGGTQWVMWSPKRGYILRGLGGRTCNKSILLLALIWFGTWVFFNGPAAMHRTMFSDLCTDDKSKRILEGLCKEFKGGVLTGDLCEDLCVSQSVEYKRCLYYQHGKRVMQADWHGLPIILKSKLENFSSYENPGPLEDQGGAGLSPADMLLYATLDIRSSIGLEAGDGNFLLGGQAGQQLGPSSRAELASLWSLLQQEEYVFFRAFQGLSRHMLKLLGSCGHFYAVERLVAGCTWTQDLFSLEELIGLPGKGPETSFRHGAWLGREVVLRIALGFLHMVRHFDSDFTHPLHLCDIKPENFGIRRDLTVVAIDVDMAFFEPKMQNILEQKCSTDEDCNFFDCISKCNTIEKRCGSKRINNNLQVICEKIFRYWFLPPLRGGRMRHPLEVELEHTVQECVKWTGGRSDAHGRTVWDRLHSLLSQLLQNLLAQTEGVGSKRDIFTVY